ncbi:MAG: MoaD/ThiS family protein [Lysobacteraceae bacterium]
MPKVVLASALSRWLPDAGDKAVGEVALQVSASTVGTALDAVFAQHPNLRGYVLDEQDTVRHHVAVFVDGDAIRNKRDLSQSLDDNSEVYVMQALSGG